MATRRISDTQFRHIGLATMVARRFWIDGHDLDDLIQECCFAIVKAEPKWNPSRGALTTFLHRAAWHRMCTILKNQSTRGRTKTGEHLSLDGEYGESSALEEYLSDPSSDPAMIVEHRDTIRRALNDPALTDGERVCLHAHAIGGDHTDTPYGRQTTGNARVKIRAAA